VCRVEADYLHGLAPVDVAELDKEGQLREERLPFVLARDRDTCDVCRRTRQITIRPVGRLGKGSKSIFKLVGRPKGRLRGGQRGGAVKSALRRDGGNKGGDKGTLRSTL